MLRFFLAGLVGLLTMGHANAGVNASEYHSVLDKLYSIYSPKVEALGKRLTIAKHWEDSTVNASAQMWGDQFIVSIYGGIARHPRVTKDALAVIACHEFGFLFGGHPKSSPPSDWATIVAQTDYYATAKCMKAYLADEDNIAYNATNPPDIVAVALCDAAYTTDAERALCARSAMAGISIGAMLGDLTSTPVDPRTPSRRRAPETNHGRPDAQCRVDTYLAGAACNVDPHTNDYCASGTLGGRPACWHKAD